MQQRHYSAAELTGDAEFPSHLTLRQARRLILSHGNPCHDQPDGSLLTSCVCSKGERTFEAQKRFTRTPDGLFRASPILLWLGY